MSKTLHRSLPAVFCMIAAGLVTTSVRGATIYVNNVVGDDAANGRTPERRSRVDAPVRSIARAVAIAQAGDTIHITNTNTPYAEPLLLDRPDLFGSPLHPVVVEGNGATLCGLRRLPQDVWRFMGNGVYRYQPLRKGHYQLYVNGGPAAEIPVPSDAPAVPALQPLQWCVFRGWVYFRVEPTKFIDQYEIEVPAVDIGIGLYDARYVIVRNIAVEGFRLDGINVHGHSRDVRIENVKCTSNGRAGLAVAATSHVGVNGIEASGNRVADFLATGLPQVELRQAKLLGGGRFGLLVEGGRVTAFGPESKGHTESEQKVRAGAELKVLPAEPAPAAPAAEAAAAAKEQ